MEGDNEMRNTDEYQNRSGSDNFKGAYGDNQDAGGDHLQKKNRHTPQQIQELEAFFKETAYPDEDQKSYLSDKLGLEKKSVSIWFQNKRTQKKMKKEHYGNKLLRLENEKLRKENNMLKEAMSNSICNSCGAPIISSQVSLEANQLKIENARLKNELNYMRALASTNPTTLPTPNFGATGRNVVGGSMGPDDVGDKVLGTPQPTLSETRSSMKLMKGNEISLDRSVMDLALASMDELIKMTQSDSPLWTKCPNEGKEVLNQEEYGRICSSFIGPKPPGYVTEASRETKVVIINSLTLVETLLDTDRWLEFFPSMIAKAVTVDVISRGMDGTKNGSLLIMHGEVQLPSPLVPVREWNILRFCKKNNGAWVIVDVSIDNGNPSRTYRRLPSGCVVQEISNTLSKITWVDHSQYDESVVHQLYRPLVNSGIGFGAYRWVATLQRQCEFFAMLMSSSVPSEDSSGISQGGRRSLLKLAQRMTNYFWSGVCASPTSNWEIFHIGINGTRFMSRKHVDHLGEAPNNVISAANSVWMPVPHQMLFDFLCDNRNRGKWDLTSSGGSKVEMLHFTKGQRQGNHISIIRDYDNNDDNGNESNMWLQDSWTDTSGSMIVYSPITVQSFNMVVNGGDPAHVSIFPSGFSILPDCGGTLTNGISSGGSNNGGGCLLTFGSQQVMLDKLHTVNPKMELANTVDEVISCTIQKIKDAFRVA